MKIQVKDIEDKPKEKVFHPFVLEFEIEDESDLEDLLARFNLSPKHVNTVDVDYQPKAKYSCGVWKYLDVLYEDKPYMK